MVTPEEQFRKPPKSIDVFCYQCITDFMHSLGKRTIDCPYCRVNKIDLANIVYADITAPQTLQVYCPNLCGLRGTTTAMAFHICPYQVRVRLFYCFYFNFDLIFR